MKLDKYIENPRLNRNIEDAQKQGFYESSQTVESLINLSIMKIDFLLEAVLNDDVDKIKNEGVGSVFINLICNNRATEGKPSSDKLIECSGSGYNNLNKRKVIELLLRLSLSLNQDQNYNNAITFFAINSLLAVCIFYGLSLDECIYAQLNEEYNN